MVDKQASDEERIPTNLRTLLILEILGRAEGPLSPTEINQHLGLPKQSIHRLCATLIDEGFIRYAENSKKLRPARRSRLIASGILHASQDYIGRRQILLDLSSTVRETVNYVVPKETGMNYLDRVETDWAFRVQLPIGTSVPFHCTASGKAYLASLPKAQRKRMVAALTLEERTANTITDRDELLDQLNEIANQGYALDLEEFLEGMVAFAVPVLDRQGRYVASLAMHGPTMRLNEEVLIGRKEDLQAAAARLAQAL